MFKDQELTELRKELEVRELKIQQLQVKADSDPPPLCCQSIKFSIFFAVFVLWNWKFSQALRRKEEKIKLNLLCTK